MVHYRRQRLGEQIQVELAELIQQEVRDPRLGFVTVTEVRMSPDLKHARVYVSIFGDESARAASLEVLEHARGFLRSRIGSRLQVRYVPELRFVLDETLDTSARIDALLDGSRALPMDEVIAVLRDNEGFVIAGHRDPDGDSLGSSLALGLALEQIGKRVAVLSSDPLSAAYARLPDSDRIAVTREAPADLPVAVLIECNGLERCGIAGLEERLVVNIDHHGNNPSFGSVNWVDPEVAAAGVMIYRLLGAMELDITPAIATHIYVAILTDTGSFRFSNTDAPALRVAADLVELGVDPAAVAEAIYENVPEAKVRLLGAALGSLELTDDGAIATMVLPVDVLHAGPGGPDTEGIVNHAQGIEGVAVSALFKEVERDRFRISLRADGSVDVAAIATSFGGGGHPRAAGFVLEGDLEACRRKVLDAVAAARAGQGT